MSKDSLSAVIVGAGYMGNKHLESYLNIPTVTIAGIVEQDAEKGRALAAKGNCPWFPSLEACFSSGKPDFADICLPSNLHRNAALEAMEQGCDVIIEKPFAVELSDIDDMINTQASTQTRLMVAHTCRFMPQYRYAKDAVDSGRFGKLLSAAFCRESETPLWSWNNWLQNREASGGTILDLSIHDIDLANWFLGRPESHRAYETASASRAGAAHVLSLLSYPSGATASITANHLMPKGYPLTASYRLVFENAALEWNTVNCEEGCLFEFTSSGAAQIPVAGLGEDAERDPYEREIAEFAACLLSGKPFPISTGEARLAVYTVKQLCGQLEYAKI